jgi:hypothetical protein
MDSQDSSAGTLILQFKIDLCKICIEYEYDAIKVCLDVNVMGIMLLSNDLAFEKV